MPVSSTFWDSCRAYSGIGAGTSWGVGSTLDSPWYSCGVGWCLAVVGSEPIAENRMVYTLDDVCINGFACRNRYAHNSDCGWVLAHCTARGKASQQSSMISAKTVPYLNCFLWLSQWLLCIFRQDSVRNVKAECKLYLQEDHAPCPSRSINSFSVICFKESFQFLLYSPMYLSLGLVPS